MQITKAEAIAYLKKKQVMLADDTLTWGVVKSELADAGQTVGYTPAFRCLVMGQAPEDSVRWKE